MAFDSSTSPLLTTTSVSGDPSVGLESSENLIAQAQYGLQVLDGGAGGQFEVRSFGNLLNIAQLSTAGLIGIAVPGVPSSIVTIAVQSNGSIMVQDDDIPGGIITISVVPSTTLQFHQTQVNGVNVGTPYNTVNFVNSSTASFVGSDGGTKANVTINVEGSFAPIDGPFVITQADADLTGATDLGILATGLVYSTVSGSVSTLSTTTAPTMSGANITAGTIPVASVVGTAVNLTSVQTISGAKTFTSNVTVATLSVVSGTIDMNAHKIEDVLDPTAAQDAATKAYVDAQTGSAAQWSTFAALQNVNMASHKLVSVTDPTAAQDAATKNYVDTSAVLLIGAQTVAGIKTFSSPPVMSGASITAGTIPVASVVGTAMDLTTAQTAAGVKTFSSAPVMSGASITAGTIPIASVVGTAMDLTTSQTAAGIKTFSSAPVMSGASITAGTIPAASVVGTAVTISAVQTITGAKTFDAQVDMNSHKIVNLLDPTLAQDAVTLSYVQAYFPALNTFSLQTVDATPTSILTFPVSSGTTVTLQGLISSNDHPSTGISFGSQFFAVARNLSGVLSLTGTPLIIENGTSTQTIDIVVNGTNLLINVTGIAATTINWNGSYSTSISS